MYSAKLSSSSHREEAIVSELERAISLAAAALMTKKTDDRQKLSEAANPSYRKALQMMVQSPPEGRPSSILGKLEQLERLLRELESRIPSTATSC